VLCNDKLIYSVKTEDVSVINTINLGDMFRFTEPSSCQFLKQSTFSECASSMNVLCFRNWHENGSVNRNMSPRLIT
jgi:hypothetical protein